MSLTDKEILELHELLDDLVENNLAGARRQRLEQWLRESEAARRHYVRFLDMSASLAHYAEERISDEDEEDLASDEQGSKIVRFVRPLLAVAAAVALVFFGLRTLKEYSAEEGGSDPETAEAEDASEPAPVLADVDAVATLTRAVGVDWAEDSELRPSLGESLRAGKLKLDAGLAQVEFRQGAYVVLEGPAEFDLTHANEGALRVGRLRANVPQVAKGFTIDTPKGKVIDLGTEFGVNVEENGVTEIFVYVGKVLFEGKDRDAELAFEELEAGEAVFIDEKGDLTFIEMPSNEYAGVVDLANRSLEEAQRRHAAWVNLSEELADDPRNVLYFTFDDHRPWSRILRDDSRAQGNRHDGAIVGCKWTSGRWNGLGKGALSFSGANDRVRLKLPLRLPSATLTSWVRLDYLDKRLNPILCAEPKTLGAACWFVDGAGRLVLRTKAAEGFARYASSVAFRPERVSRWTHLATTYDAEKRLVAHYVDGRPFSREKMQEGSIRLTFAHSQLGHSHGNEKNAAGRQLRGSLDEFAIFREALEEEEIRALYEIGRPDALPPRMSPVVLP